MRPSRDPEADDRFVDMALGETLGGRRAPDFAARLADLDPSAAARAAAAVDEAARAAATRRSPWLWLAAAALLATSALLLTFGGGDSAGVPAERHDTATALLDAFHRVMPRQPTSLRDPERRERVAPRALPILRRIAAFHAAHPEDPTFAGRANEFEVWAMVLGDEATERSLAARSARGEIDAEALLLAANTIRATGERARAASLSRLEELFGTPFPAAANVAWCLVTAADLSEAEAQALARAAADPALARRFDRAAELAHSSPRRLLGQPLELAGRLVDGGEFSTASLRGRVVLVFFWATWCEPSLAALTEVNALRQQYPRSDLAVVGVSCDHDRDALSAYLAEHRELAWPQMFDRGQPGWHEFAWLCGVRSIPSLMLLDREGIVREVDLIDEVDVVVRRALRR